MATQKSTERNVVVEWSCDWFIYMETEEQTHENKQKVKTKAYSVLEVPNPK